MCVLLVACIRAPYPTYQYYELLSLGMGRVYTNLPKSQLRFCKSLFNRLEVKSPKLQLYNNHIRTEDYVSWSCQIDTLKQ